MIFLGTDPDDDPKLTERVDHAEAVEEQNKGASALNACLGPTDLEVGWGELLMLVRPVPIFASDVRRLALRFLQLS